MTGRPTTLERAFELARSGEYVGVSDLRQALIAEGYTDVTAQLTGPSLVSQLRRICVEARRERE
jgi:hypothetical protein